MGPTRRRSLQWGWVETRERISCGTRFMWMNELSWAMWVNSSSKLLLDDFSAELSYIDQAKRKGLLANVLKCHWYILLHNSLDCVDCIPNLGQIDRAWWCGVRRDRHYFRYGRVTSMINHSAFFTQTRNKRRIVIIWTKSSISQLVVHMNISQEPVKKLMSPATPGWWWRVQNPHTMSKQYKQPMSCWV